MPFLDGPTVIESGGNYGEFIGDWALGDDRIITRTIAAALLQAGDAITDAYFMLKQNLTDLDVNAILGLHITTALQSIGQITGSNPFQLQFVAFSNAYQSKVTDSTIYYYSIRIVTQKGNTWTCETGTVQFQDTAVLTDAAAVTPAPFDNGFPTFKGYTGGPPTVGGPYVVGDWFRNQNPQSGEPSGWTCIAAGSPGTWRTDGIVGDTDGS